MSSGNMLKQKKGIQLPHIYVLLFSIIVVCTILTWVLPAGEFDRVVNEATGRTVAVAGTFHTVKQSPVGIFQMFQAIYNGMCDAGSVTFFVFISYASINIIISSGAFNGLVAGLLKVFKGKARVGIIPIFMFIVGIASSTIGLFEEWFPFVPVFAGIAVAMGFDAVVGVAIVAFGAAMGYSGAMMNPFTVGVAQGIAEVAPMSGMGYRFFCHMALLVVGSALTIRYALKIQADPSKSLVYGETEHITMSEDDVQNSPFGIREKLVLLILLAGIIAVVYGCKVYGWYFAELSAVFVIMGILSAIVMGWGPNKIGELYSKGFTDIAMACMMIGLARGILMVLQAGNIIDTVVYYFSLPLAVFPSWFCGVAMLVMQTLLNFLIPSGSGKGALLAPIIVPIAMELGLTSQTAVLAYQFGDGITNMFWFSYGTLMIFLNYAKVPVQKWYKFFLPLMAIYFLFAFVSMGVAIAIGF